MKSVGARGSIFPALALGFLVLGSTVPGFAGTVSFTCDASIAADGPSGLCNYLNNSIGTLYGSTFTNANADIYIEYANLGSTPGHTGLADSTSGPSNPVTYSTYQNALQSESTDPAKAYVPATEPGIFGSDNIDVTSALGAALGLGGMTGTTAG